LIKKYELKNIYLFDFQPDKLTSMKSINLLHRKIFFTLCFASAFVLGCENQKKITEPEPAQDQISSKAKTEDVENKFSTPTEKTEPVEETVNGNYFYEGLDAKCKILVMGDQWTGSFTFVSGFGDEYDASQAEFQTGVVRGNEIFDESGLVKIGYIEGKNLTTTVGGQYITLKRKN
jgi:hypothetical protein